MTSTQLVANDISYNMADDDEIYSNAEKEWIPAGILLIPVFTRKEYLRAIGNELGETEYYRSLSVKHKLKESKFGVLTNHFKKIVEFIEDFKNIDLSSITVNRTHDLFKEAKKLGQGKITSQNVKIVLDKLINRKAIKTTTDFRMYNTIKKYVKHAQELNLDDLGDPNNLSPFNEDDAEPFNNRRIPSQLSDTEIKPNDETTKKPSKVETKSKMPINKITEKDVEPTTTSKQKKIEGTSNKIATTSSNKPIPEKVIKHEKVEALEKVIKHEKIEALEKVNEHENVKETLGRTIEEKPIVEISSVSNSDQSTLIGAYKELDIELQSHIIEMATLMQGEQDIALLKSLDKRQVVAILKTIQLIAKSTSI
jgi:hypothetical protein